MVWCGGAVVWCGVVLVEAYVPRFDERTELRAVRDYGPPTTDQRLQMQSQNTQQSLGQRKKREDKKRTEEIEDKKRTEEREQEREGEESEE